MRDKGVRLALIVGTTHRVLTLIIAAWAFNTRPVLLDWNAQPLTNVYAVAFTAQGWLRSLLEPWFRWDTGWYINIAYEGYASNLDKIIFPPLYPLLIRIVAPVFGGDYLLAALVISTLAAYIALYLLYTLTASEHDERTARWAVVLFVCYPAAFYLMAGYTESLFIALVLGAWLSVNKRRYVLAGILAFLAALTRVQGAVLGLPFAYLIYLAPHLQAGLMIIPAIRQAWTQFFDRPLKEVGPLLAVFGGLIGFAVYIIGIRLAGYGSVTERYASPFWQTPSTTPWESVIRAVQAVAAGTSNPYFVTDLLSFLTLLFIVVLGVWMWRRLKTAYLIYVGVSLIFILTRSNELYQLHGILRYALAMFPLFIMLALLLQKDHPVARIMRVTYCVVGVLMQALLLMLFVWWGWVS